MATLIELFDVPPGADEAFLADWRREGTGSLYRALRDDVPLRFVSIGDAPSGSYALVHDDRGFDAAGGILQIAPFDAPADEPVIARWHRLREALASQRGYLAARLYRSEAPTDPRFVSMIRWSSPLMVARALRHPDVTAAALPARSALYQEVRWDSLTGRSSSSVRRRS